MAQWERLIELWYVFTRADPWYVCRVRLTGLEIPSSSQLYINTGVLCPIYFYDGYIHCSTRRYSGELLTLCTCTCYIAVCRFWIQAFCQAIMNPNCLKLWWFSWKKMFEKKETHTHTRARARAHTHKHADKILSKLAPVLKTIFINVSYHIYL